MCSSAKALRKLGDDANRFRRACGALGFIPRTSATSAAIARESYCWAAAGLSPEETLRRTEELLKELEHQLVGVAQGMLKIYREKGLRLIERDLAVMDHGSLDHRRR
jgi:hypothetical protein